MRARLKGRVRNVTGRMETSMGIRDFFAGLFGSKGYDVEELARRLDIPIDELKAVPVAYKRFTVRKRSGGTRTLLAPEPALKRTQRRILRRLLARLKTHPAATGFQKGHSIVTNALPHVGKAVVIRLDIRDFFPATHAKRVKKYFRKIGWNNEAATLLTRLCTWENGLPQGAPTSPRLSNLVNYRLDARLEGLAHSQGAAYTRYADDMTFSLAATNHRVSSSIVFCAKRILRDFKYTLHMGKKLRIRRAHQQQRVTGLVVNNAPNLPRGTRRWLRAVEHRHATGRNATLTPAQLAGWKALQNMIATQRQGETISKLA